jgi:hypothetical protein
MKKVLGYFLSCIIFYSVLVMLRILVMVFILRYPKVETTPHDLIAPLIATVIWLVLMIIFSGFKKGKLQKGEV